MWQADRSPDAPGRLENLKELVVAMAEFENLTGFLEHVSLVMDNAADSAGDMVNLMTLHSAKGLEFDTVCLPGWEEGLFPSLRSVEEHGLKGLEEERRLAYVGLTRARHRAFVSFAANRRIHGQWQSAARSRFIDELSPDHVEIITEMGLGPAAAAVSIGTSPGWTAASPGWGAAWNQSQMGRAGRQPLLIESARVPLLDAALEVRLALAAAGAGGKLKHTAEERLAERDWLLENRRAFPPIRIGRFFVHGSHWRGPMPPGMIAIEIDAATAFGTG